MNVYLSDKTITSAYRHLTSTKHDDASVFFTWLILKYAGVNNLTFTNPAEESFKEKLLKSTSYLAYLFNDDKKLKIKHNFINPLNMTSWGNEATESISSWTRNRLVNNVSGGGRHWKEILTFDDEISDSMKLKSNYLNKLRRTNKIPLPALIIWTNKLVEFDHKVTYSELLVKFKNEFNITNQELLELFDTKEILPIDYGTDPIDMKIIRDLIQSNETKAIWTDSTVNAIDTENRNEQYIYTYTDVRRNQTMISKEEIIDYLKLTKQMIFTGPPGTSKSFFATQIAENFETITIQFHPQYSYQEFIGGETLKDGTLEYEKGLLLNLIDSALNKKEVDYLLVIDEINRANISQVFGELIQLLDRGQTVSIKGNEYYLPNNLYILGTMNTSDRTLGRIDYAIKRRFPQIYFPSSPNELSELCLFENNELSLADFLSKINSNLISVLKNRELVVGHAIFLKDFAYNEELEKFYWDYQSINKLFNFYMLPIIEEYCNFDSEIIEAVLGSSLPETVYGEEFKNSIIEFIS